MKKTLFLLYCIVCLSIASAQDTTKHIRTGWNFGVLPSVAFDADLEEHENAISARTAAIRSAQEELAAIEARQTPPAPAAPEAANNNERTETIMPNTLNIRTLPLTQRAFDALPLAQRDSIVAQDDVQTFFAKLRSMKGANAALQGGELTIPVIFLDLIAEKITGDTPQWSGTWDNFFSFPFPFHLRSAARKASGNSGYSCYMSSPPDAVRLRKADRYKACCNFSRG